MKKICIIVSAAIVGVLTGIILEHLIKRKHYEKLNSELNKYTDNYLMVSHWLQMKNNGGSVAAYFNKMGYKRIAIYGMAELAVRLCEDLNGTDVEVVYGIDRDACNSVSAIQEVYAPDDELPQVDVIIVTPFYAYDNIKDMLEKKISCPITSIENIVWSI